MPEFLLHILFQQLPFLVEWLLEWDFENKSRELAILKRGRSNGNPSLRCRDLLASTANQNYNYTKSRCGPESEQTLLYQYIIKITSGHDMNQQLSFSSKSFYKYTQTNYINGTKIVLREQGWEAAQGKHPIFAKDYENAPQE